MASSKAAKIPNCTYTYRTVRVDTSYVHIHVYTKDTVLLQEVLLDPIVYTHTHLHLQYRYYIQYVNIIGSRNRTAIVQKHFFWLANKSNKLKLDYDTCTTC